METSLQTTLFHRLYEEIQKEKETTTTTRNSRPDFHFLDTQYRMHPGERISDFFLKSGCAM